MLVTAWYNSQPFHTPPLSLSLIHNALLKYQMNDTTYQLTVTNHPLPYDDGSKLNQAAIGSPVGFQVAFNIVFGMAFLSASYVIFLGTFFTAIIEANRLVIILRLYRVSLGVYSGFLKDFFKDFLVPNK